MSNGTVSADTSLVYYFFPARFMLKVCFDRKLTRDGPLFEIVWKCLLNELKDFGDFKLFKNTF